jgi:hypothetical protein
MMHAPQIDFKKRLLDARNIYRGHDAHIDAV